MERVFCKGQSFLRTGCGGVCALWFLSNIYLFHLLQKEKSDFIAAMKCKQDLICLVDILQHLI